MQRPFRMLVTAGLLMSEKQDLRKWAKQRRREIYWDDEQFCLKLTQTKEYQQAKNIMLFYPMKYEVNLLSLLNDKTKRFYLPKIEGEELLCCPFCLGDRTCLSNFKTVEPLSNPVDKSLVELVIVPALCCDKKNYRLGYGGGFYDRFLNSHSCYSITCISKEQIVDSVFPEKHDMPVNMVITC